MTYKEFEKWCEEEEGYVCNRDDRYLTVYDDECAILFVGIKVMYSIDSDCVDCTHSIPKKLFKKAVKLASTPLKDREEQKRYYVKIVDREDGYINKTSSGDLLLLNNLHRFNYQTKFTEEEIKEIDERFMPFAVEVEQ